MQDFNRQHEFEPEQADEGSELREAPKQEEPIKAPRKQFSYKKENLLEDENGLKALFRQFTMQPETINSLRGTKHSEVSDLHKFVQYLKAWHLVHCPKIEFYFFLEKVQKLGKEKEVQNYLQKLRNHYKGEEILEEFQTVLDV